MDKEKTASDKLHMLSKLVLHRVFVGIILIWRRRGGVDVMCEKHIPLLYLQVLEGLLDAEIDSTFLGFAQHLLRLSVEQGQHFRRVGGRKKLKDESDLLDTHLRAKSVERGDSEMTGQGGDSSLVLSSSSWSTLAKCEERGKGDSSRKYAAVLSF